MVIRYLSPFETSFKDLENLQEQINRAFSPLESYRPKYDTRGMARAMPIELIENPTHYLLKASLPGIAAADIDINATGKTIVISAKHTEQTTEKTDTLHLQELQYGEFRRSIEFVDNIETDQIQAKYEHGLLHLSIPKKNAKEQQSIKITVQS